MSNSATVKVSNRYQIALIIRRRAIVKEQVGSMAKIPQMAMAMGFTLEQVAMLVPDLLTEENLGAIEVAFAEL